MPPILQLIMCLVHPVGHDRTEAAKIVLKVVMCISFSICTIGLSESAILDLAPLSKYNTYKYKLT